MLKLVELRTGVLESAFVDDDWESYLSSGTQNFSEGLVVEAPHGAVLGIVPCHPRQIGCGPHACNPDVAFRLIDAMDVGAT